MSTLRLCLIATAFAIAAQLPSLARQATVGRIRGSLDKATGGATATQSKNAAASAPVAPQIDPAAVAKAQKARDAQVSAIAAGQNQRNQKALVGADQRVVDFLKQRVEDGSAGAAFDLAKRYEEGKGVEEDATEARRLYKLSAERGNDEAKKWLEEHPEPKKETAKGEQKPAVK